MSNDLKKIIDLFYQSRMSQTFGMKLDFNDNHEAIFTMPYDPKFDHSLEDIHGGVLATLIDNAGWFTVAAHYSSWVVTADLHTRLLEPAKKMELKAIGHLVRTGKSLAVAEMQIHSSDNRLIAIGSGSFSVTSKKIE